MKPFLPVVIALTILGSTVYGEPTPEEKTRIETLIRQLGDDEGAVRREATRALAEIGAPALPALQRASKSEDPEVRMRAKQLVDALLHPTAEQLQQLRDAVRKAFREGDYAAMIGPARRLTVPENAERPDRMWVGHAFQLAGRWKEAVDAYRDVLRRMDAELKAGPKLPPPPPPGAHPEAFEGLGIKGRLGPAIRRAPRPDPKWRQKLIRKRTFLALWVARMQRVELKDPMAAAQGLVEALGHLDLDKGKVERLWFEVLKELAIAQEEAGVARAALLTWNKLHQACREDSYGNRVSGYLDMERVARLLGRIDPKEPPPDLSFIYFLSPNQGEVHLLPDEDDTRRRAYDIKARWHFAFAPPRGKEFATLEFACDIEQLKERFGGQFYCFVRVPGVHPRALRLGSIGWGADKPIGREVRSASFDIPPGVRMVNIETGTARGCFNVHRVDVKATFRPAAEKPPPLAPHVGAWMQTEFIPEGGKGSCGEKELLSRRAYTDVKPGKYRLRYEVPGRKDVFETGFVIEPGRRYGIFVNLDSPFKWTQAAPGGMGSSPAGGLGIAPLPDGGYIAVWGDVRQRIMTCRTKDLLTWTKPEPAPFNSVFHNMTPTTFTAKDGTVWLAFFSNRLALLDPGKREFHLWLTSTRDGQAWTPLQPISTGQFVGCADAPVHMLEAPDGKCWMFWQKRAASAGSIGEIRELGAINIPEAPKTLSPDNVFVTVDGQGRFRMAVDSIAQGICHMVSTDGLNWSAPVPLVEPKHGLPMHPRLILAGDKALLFYQYRGAWVTPIRFDGKPLAPGTGLKITGHVIPLYGSRLRITKDGEVLLIAGADTSWLLRAKLSDLLKLCDAKKE